MQKLIGLYKITEKGNVKYLVSDTAPLGAELLGLYNNLSELVVLANDVSITGSGTLTTSYHNEFYCPIMVLDDGRT